MERSHQVTLLALGQRPQRIAHAAQSVSKAREIIQATMDWSCSA